MEELVGCGLVILFVLGVVTIALIVLAISAD